MKKIMLVLVVLALTAFPVTAFADDGVINNPNHFELDINCGGAVMHAYVPTIMSNGGHVADGRTVHIRTHYIDFDFDNMFEQDELVGSWGGRGNQTVWCTWTWDNDPFVHGMDVQFSPAE